MFVSAAISRKGVPRWILRSLKVGLFELFACPQLLAELNDVLLRDKFRRYIARSAALVYVSMIHERATIVPLEEVLSVTRDPDDDYLVALAQQTRADYLVSGDGDLLDLEEIGLPQIVSPREFLEILESSLPPVPKEYRRRIR